MKKFWKNTKLKLQLLRIWFVKNIVMFLEIAGITLLILMLTGVLPEDTPVLGFIFGDLIASIHKILEKNDVNSGWMAFFSASISIVSAVGMFALKARSISIKDIKSDKLKLALIQAGLYFNSDGKLVKRVEKATQIDIDGDGKIAEEEDIKIFNGPISRTFNAIREFAIIVGTDFAENDDVKSDNYDAVLEKADLKKAAEGQKELSDNLKSDAVVAVGTVGENYVSAEIQKTLDEGDVEDPDTVLKVSALKKISAWFKLLPERYEARKAQKAKEKEEKEEAKKLKKDKTTEVIVNNVEKDSEEKTLISKSTISTPAPVVKEQISKKVNTSSIDAMRARFKH